MEFNKLLKNTSLLAGTRLLQFITGLVRIKLIAYYLGTLGTGLVDQLNFVTQKMSQFTLLSMSEALVKQISENKDSSESKQLINSAYKAYFILVGTFMFISCTILYLFSEYLTIYVFGEVSYISYFYIGLFSFPLLVLDSIPFSILKAFKDVKEIAKARTIIVIINLLIALPLILIFKLEGAIAFIPLSYLINLLINFFFAKNKYFNKLNINLKSIMRAKMNSSFLKELLVFSTFGITVGVFATFSELFCRSIVVSKLGIESIGLYSPIIMWAGVVTGFLLPSFSTYLYPRFCELKTNKEISGLLNDGLRLGTMAIIPLIFIGIPFCDLFISLFYTDDFLGASKFLPYHFLGVIFYVWYYVFTQAMTPTGRIKQHGILMFLYLSLDILVTYLFVNEYGLYGWMLKHLISPFIFFWIYYFYAKKYMGLILDMNTLFIMIYLFSGSIIITLINLLSIDGRDINYLVGPLFLLMSILLLNKNEQIFLKNKFYAITKLK